MSRFAVRADDRLHMLVWRAPLATWWCVARAINGVPITAAARYDTWAEALQAAIEEES